MKHWFIETDISIPDDWNCGMTKEEVIHCKDCKHFNDGDCEELPKIVSETDFCSFAERK